MYVSVNGSFICLIVIICDNCLSFVRKYAYIHKSRFGERICSLTWNLLNDKLLNWCMCKKPEHLFVCNNIHCQKICEHTHNLFSLFLKSLAQKEATLGLLYHENSACLYFITLHWPIIFSLTVIYNQRWHPAQALYT